MSFAMIGPAIRATRFTELLLFTLLSDMHTHNKFFKYTHNQNLMTFNLSEGKYYKYLTQNLGGHTYTTFFIFLHLHTKT